MMKFSTANAAVMTAIIIIILSNQVIADMEVNHDHNGTAIIWADDHAPISVMGDHTHAKDEWMLSYRYMHMDMEGNRIGTNEVSPETIVSTVPNRFFGLPMQPPILRIVPTNMTMDMHMFGMMYAPTDWLTLMGMASYITKEMDHITFQGGVGTTRLGTFTVETEGIGDTRLTGLIKIYEHERHSVHLNAGIGLPTGSTDETHQILTPMGTRPTVRVPYAMQIGSGTYDLIPGITYKGDHNQLAWGAQYIGTFRVDENDEDYALGDRHIFTSWLSYQWRSWISTSLRIEIETADEINGRDSNIIGPVQTADPDNYGGDIVNFSFGINLAGQTESLRGHRLAIEAVIPLHRDLNGPQMETDFVIMAGWQYTYY